MLLDRRLSRRGDYDGEDSPLPWSCQSSVRSSVTDGRQRNSNATRKMVSILCWQATTDVWRCYRLEHQGVESSATTGRIWSYSSSTTVSNVWRQHANERMDMAFFIAKRFCSHQRQINHILFFLASSITAYHRLESGQAALDHSHHRYRHISVL